LEGARSGMEVWVEKEWGFVLKKVGEKVRCREVEKGSEMQKVEEELGLEKLIRGGSGWRKGERRFGLGKG